MRDDLVKRDFTADDPNRLWLADITGHRTGEGKLYLCAIKDVWSHRIVGYSIDSRTKSRLAVNALHNAVTRRGDHRLLTQLRAMALNGAEPRRIATAQRVDGR